MNREQIYSALFAKLSGAANFNTASRRLRHWSDVTSAEQPALFQAQKHETAHRARGQPPKWTLALDIYVYAQAPDDRASPATILNPLIDALETALAPSGADIATNVQTLGSLVSHCWIAGQIVTDEGVLGGQAVAIVPIEIVVP